MAQDRTGRGIVTSSSFQHVLDELQLEYGSTEVDIVRPLLKLTSDGYVVFKELIEDVRPRNALARSTIGDTILPGAPDVERQCQMSTPDIDFTHPAALRASIVANTDNLRRLFSAFDRGAFSERQLLAEIRGIGLPISGDLERLLVTHGPSRTLKFSQLMTALQVEDPTSGRRQRQVAEATERPPLQTIRPTADPVAWRHEPLRGTLIDRSQISGPAGMQGVGVPGTGTQNIASTTKHTSSWEDSQRSRMSPSRIPSSVPAAEVPKGELSKRLVADYVDGVTSFVVFREEVKRKLDVTIDDHSDLMRLVRRIESGGSVAFHEFAKVLFRISPTLLQNQEKGTFPPQGGVRTPYALESDANRSEKVVIDHASYETSRLPPAEADGSSLQRGSSASQTTPAEGVFDHRIPYDIYGNPLMPLGRGEFSPNHPDQEDRPIASVAQLSNGTIHGEYVNEQKTYRGDNRTYQGHGDVVGWTPHPYEVAHHRHQQGENNPHNSYGSEEGATLRNLEQHGVQFSNSAASSARQQPNYPQQRPLSHASSSAAHNQVDSRGYSTHQHGANVSSLAPQSHHPSNQQHHYQHQQRYERDPRTQHAPMPTPAEPLGLEVKRGASSPDRRRSVDIVHWGSSTNLQRDVRALDNNQTRGEYTMAFSGKRTFGGRSEANNTGRGGGNIITWT